MEADIHTLYRSDFYHILDFRCRCSTCSTSKPEHATAFCISFVRTGNFVFNVFRHSLDSYNGCILITKPEYEHTVTHTHAVPDQCTIFEFTPAFYAELRQRYAHTSFFRSNDLHSTLLKTSHVTEFLHFFILQLVQQRTAAKLHIDQLVMEMVATILGTITDYQPDKRINARLKRNHLATVEKAKNYITGNFTQDISLMEIAGHCFISPFHFSRIFKIFTNYSPHQFLLSIRLKHAEMLLLNTTLPVADIAFSSGFNSIEHFTAAFRQQYHRPPGTFRSEQIMSRIP